MKVWLDRDEWWSSYNLLEKQPSDEVLNFYGYIELTEQEFVEYGRVLSELNRWQERFDIAFEQTRRGEYDNNAK
jgi:hypothetical protein